MNQCFTNVYLIQYHLYKIKIKYIAYELSTNIVVWWNLLLLLFYYTLFDLYIINKWSLEKQVDADIQIK